MRAESHPPIAVLIVALLGSVAALIAVAQEAVERVPDLWDAAGRHYIGDPTVRLIWIGLTVIGGGTGLLVLAGIVVAFLVRGGRNREALFVFVAIIGAEIVDRVFKSLVDRPRPRTAEAAKVVFGNGYGKLVLVAVLVAVLLSLPSRWRPFALAAGGAFFALFALDLLVEAAIPIHQGFDSFPSGHAVGSMALVASVVVVLKPTRWRGAAVVACLAFTFVVGASRVWLGFHHPSDVIGGWSLGLAWVITCWFLLSVATGAARRNRRHMGSEEAESATYPPSSQAPLRPGECRP
jgi:membrane-associated phospholipid phosphatase